VRYGRTLGFHEPFFFKLVDVLAATMGDVFPEIRARHQFVKDVLAKGAAGVVVQADQASSFTSETRAGVVAVDDTLLALQDMAREIRRQSGAKVVAITGSAGKTTTKEAIADCLAARYQVVKNKGNLNNHIGLPLSLTELRTLPDVAVMELGMNHAGEIRTLVSIAEPDVRVWTNVGDAHIGFFDSADAIADAKAEILEGSDDRTVLVCNADDPRVMSRVQQFAGRTVTFGTAAEATVRAQEVEDLGLDGMRATVSTPAGERTITTPLLGRGNLSNALAAVAVSLELGVSLDAAATRVAGLTPAPRRGAVHRLRDDVRLVDDSYNSSPTALRRALDVMAHTATTGRKVAVLGEMLELGDHADELHRECGKAAAEAGVDRLFVIGGAPARALGDAALEAGLTPSTVTWFPRSEDAASAVVADIGPGDAVLVKGSRGIRTDVIVDRLTAELG